MTRIDLKTMCEEVLSGPLALAIGNFDGVHIGHRALLARVREAAETLRGEIPNIRTGVWCFAQPPSAFLSDKPVPQLSTTEEKLASLPFPEADKALIMDRIARQKKNAHEWCDIVNSFFYRFSGVEDAKGRPLYL